MPIRRVKKRCCSKSKMTMHPKRVSGGSKASALMKWIRGTVQPWLKKHKVVSKTANHLSTYKSRFSKPLKMGAAAAALYGYGRKRKGRTVKYRRRKYPAKKNKRGGSLGGYP